MIRKARWSRWDHFGLWAIFAAIVWVVAWAVTDVTRNLNISAMEVSNVRAGEPITIDVARDIQGQWNGAYRVTIRSAPGGSMVCTTGNIYLPYSQWNRDGSDRELPIPVTLQWWADGGSCDDDLADNTLPVGQYAVESCHAKRFLRLWYKWHCWQGGPIFRVTD